MKKTLSLLLVLVLCLSLCACGSQNADTQESTASAIIGTWVCISDQRIVINGDSGMGTQIVIEEDKTGTMLQGERTIAFTWEYDEATRKIILFNPDDETSVEIFTYLEAIDSLHNDWTGLLVRTE